MLTSFTLLVSMYHLNIKKKKKSDSTSHWINQFRVFKPCLGQFFLFYFLSVFLCVGISLDCLVSSQTTICLGRVFGLDPSLRTQPKNHMLFPLNTGCNTQKKKPLDRFSSCKLFWVGSIYFGWCRYADDDWWVWPIMVWRIS